MDFVNNWDLVDLSCYKIIGEYLLTHLTELQILDKFAVSENLWRRRIAIMSTFAFIKNGNNAPTYHIADILLTDSHDLIHKAVGWMLREAGKNNVNELYEYLKLNYSLIPRTCLRYAIEKFA
jgi:3-methyladenine DNA glycosylase AlkD